MTWLLLCGQSSCIMCRRFQPGVLIISTHFEHCCSVLRLLPQLSFRYTFINSYVSLPILAYNHIHHTFAALYFHQKKRIKSSILCFVRWQLVVFVSALEFRDIQTALYDHMYVFVCLYVLTLWIVQYSHTHTHTSQHSHTVCLVFTTCPVFVVPLPGQIQLAVACLSCLIAVLAVSHAKLAVNRTYFYFQSTSQ